MSFRFLAIYTITITAIFLCFFNLKVSAGSPNDIFVNMTPENPTPNQNVSIILSSYSYNLNTIKISWYLNGKKVLEGVGKKTYSTTAGSLNTENNVSVTVGAPDGDIDLKIKIKASNMTMLYQAMDSFVPPFYRGKALPTLDSKIKVVPMPEIISGGKLVDPNNMTYDWKIDYYTNDADASGYGKNYYIYTNDYLDRVNNIEATASTVDQSYSAKNNINISAANPKIVFYKKDAKLGTLWENAIPNNYQISEDVVLEADPYYISPKNPMNPILSWTWSINDTPVYLDSIIKNVIPLKKTPGVSGNAKIRLNIDNQYKFFQTTNKELNIQF